MMRNKCTSYRHRRGRIYCAPIPKCKKTAQKGGLFKKLLGFLSLTGFEARLSLVDHVNTAFTAYYAAITMPVLQRAK